MELYQRIIKIIDANLIYCFPPLILFLLLIKLLFKNKFKTKEALNAVRWSIIFYTIVTACYFIIGMIITPNKFTFTNKATGTYWFAFWLMLLSSTVLPFTLLIKKLASKFLYVFLVSILIKIGSYFERFIILVTSFHRDYATQGENFNWSELGLYLILVFVQGLSLAILLLVIVELVARVKLWSERSKVK